MLLVVFGALVELQRQLNQLRAYLGLVDQRADPVPFTVDRELSAVGLPPASLKKKARHAVLVLSDHCVICAEIADWLPKTLPEGLSVVLHSMSAGEAAKWLSGHGLRNGSQIVHDHGGEIMESLGVSVAPVVVQFESGSAVRALTVPSVLQAQAVFDWLTDDPSQIASH